ncbi:hypothetical protein PL2TA16_00186, partial [Pseudoalteromonas luteoviolacea 2ta16]
KKLRKSDTSIKNRTKHPISVCFLYETKDPDRTNQYEWIFEI